MGFQYRISQECREHAIGQEWTFARFTRRTWESLADYGKLRLPNPLETALAVIDQVTAKDAEILAGLRSKDEAEAAKAKEEKRKPLLVSNSFRPYGAELWDRAYAYSQRYLEAGSPELHGLLRSHEGKSMLCYLLLKTNHPDITDDAAHDVYWDLMLNASADEPDGRKSFDEIVEVCSGRAPQCLKNELSPA